MRFLSTRRRHKAARPLALVTALFLMGGIYSGLSPAQSTADPTTDPQVAAGQQLFLTNCSSCHGLNGEGTSQGPSLIGVGAASVDFQVGTGRMPMARPEGQAPAKPMLPISEADRLALAKYIASLGTGAAIPTDAQVNTSGLTAEQLARGGELFKTNCSACHNFEGEGGALPNGAYAPSLTKTSPVHIYEAVRTGPQQMPVFSSGVLTDQDVREIIGYLESLHGNPNNGGLSLGGLGPVSEGFWGWIIGIGACVFVARWLAKKGARAR